MKSTDLKIKNTTDLSIIQKLIKSIENFQSYNLINESVVGISQYMNNSTGFCGHIKKNLSDFIVKEIDNRGNVVEITNTLIPNIEQKIYRTKKITIDETVINNSLSKLENQIGTDELIRFKEYINNSNEESEFLFKNVTSKDKRTLIHTIIKETFPKYISITKTCELPYSRQILIIKRTPENTRKYSIRERNPDKEFFSKLNTKPYLHFTLCKENYTTTGILSKFANIMKINFKNFSFCGNKDKRGITTQRVSVYKVTAKRILSLAKTIKNVKVGNFSYEEKNLKLGKLKGNYFEITLRNLSTKTIEEANKEIIIKSRIENLIKKGFINYFGLQRFGTGYVPTHIIGKTILKRKWDEVISLILFPRVDKNHKKNDFRKILIETGDIKESIQSCPKNLEIERSVMFALSKYKNSFKTVFDHIYRPIKSMYVHAYQSYVWNLVVSERIKMSPHKPMVGDLILIDDGKSVENNGSYKKPLIKILTKEDIEKESYSIFDIVLPLPNHGIVLPKNELSNIFYEIISKDGINLSMFSQLSKERSFILYPDYRKIAIIPKQIEWEFKRDPNLCKNIDSCVLKFKLPSSTYATIFIRELTKQNLSSIESYKSTLLVKRILNDILSSENIFKSSKVN